MRKPIVFKKPQGLPRTVARCEQYLDRLAEIIHDAGPSGKAYLPLVERLERELAEAKVEEALERRVRERYEKLKGRGK